MAYEGDDWIKIGTWDLYAVNAQGFPELITDIKTLCSFLGRFDAGTPSDRGRLQRFMELPAARPMPARLKREVDRFLASGRDNLPG